MILEAGPVPDGSRKISDPWKQLVVEHARRDGLTHLRIARRIVGESASAEDVCQQAYLKALTAEDRIREPQRLTGWLTRVIVNESLDALRRRKQQVKAGHVLGQTSLRDTNTADPEQQRDLLTQLAGFYDGRAGWYATTGRDVRMGLTEQPVNAYEPIVTRLSLETPDGGVISTDLALFPGQDVIVEAPRPDGSPVRYAIRVQPPDNGYHSTTLNLTISVGDGPSMSTQLLLEGAAVREVGRLLTDQGEYQFRLGLAGSS